MTAELLPEQVAELHELREVELVDVRSDEEHAAGHIAGARHLPLDVLARSAAELDHSKPLVFYCRVGERSAAAAEAFTAAGRQAYNMAGGLESWVAQGLPLEPEDGLVAGHPTLPPR